MTEILIGVISGIVSGTGMRWWNNINIFTNNNVRYRAAHSTSNKSNIFYTNIVNLKNKNIDLKLAIVISIFGILGAIIGANISIHIDVKILKKCFGIFLAIIAINEIYTISKKYKKEKINNTK